MKEFAAHAQELNLRILRILKSNFSLDAVNIISVSKSLF